MINEIWCSICCRFMDEGCKKCSHFDEQVHLDQEDKVDTSPEHLTEDLISLKAAIDIVEFECGEFTGLAKEISKQLRQLPKGGEE